MGVTIRVEGLNNLVGHLNGLPEQIRSGARTAVGGSSEEIRDDARGDVPVASGDLRDAIEVEPEGDGLEAKVGVFGEPAAYATHVELGTSRMPAQPFMVPAAERERQRFSERVAEDVREAIQ